jgi:phosphate-selective porin OprO/OprP
MLLKRSYCKPLLGAFLAVAAMAAPVGVYAVANDAMLQLLKVLKDKGTIDQATYDSIVAASKADDEHVTFAEDEVKRQQKETPVIDAKKFQITSADKNFKWKVGGRIHFDYTNPTQGTGTIGLGTMASPITHTRTNFEEKAAFRRVRLQVEGTVYHDWDIKVQYDFADTSGSIAQGVRDAYIKYNFKLLGDNPAWLQFGQYNEYITLEEQTSSNDMPFIERSQLAAAFDATNGRRVGVGADVVWKDMLMTQVGAFGRELGQPQGTPGTGADATDALRVTGRAVLAPWHTSNRVLHLGGAFSWISGFDSNVLTPALNPRPDFDTDASGTRPFGSFYPGGAFTTTPFSTATNTTLVTCTGNATARHAGCATDGWRYGAEAAFVYGPWSLQGEWQTLEVNRTGVIGADPVINGNSLSFDSWYIFGTWLITGESRGYDLAEGKFKNPKPSNPFGKGGYGAWELAARYDEVDLYDKNLMQCTKTTTANFCGIEDIVTVGINWYPNDVIKFMANYVDVVDFRHGRFDGMNPSAFVLRAQAAF